MPYPLWTGPDQIFFSACKRAFEDLFFYEVLVEIQFQFYKICVFWWQPCKYFKEEKKDDK